MHKRKDGQRAPFRPSKRAGDISKATQQAAPMRKQNRNNVSEFLSLNLLLSLYSPIAVSLSQGDQKSHASH